MSFKWAVAAAPQPVRRISVAQGEYKVFEEPNIVLTTILGSCVAACIRDAKAGVGGMNHFVLPYAATQTKFAGDPSRYGLLLMEQLVNALRERGARLQHMEAQIFGGANSFQSPTGVGERNVAFALAFLKRKGISVVGGYVGGSSGCKLGYWPLSGRIEHSLIKPPETPRVFIRNTEKTPLYRPHK